MTSKRTNHCFGYRRLYLNQLKDATLKNKTKRVRGFNIIRPDRVRPKNVVLWEAGKTATRGTRRWAGSSSEGYAKHQPSGLHDSSLILRRNNLQNCLRPRLKCTLLHTCSRIYHQSLVETTKRITVNKIRPKWTLFRLMAEQLAPRFNCVDPKL